MLALVVVLLLVLVLETWHTAAEHGFFDYRLNVARSVEHEHRSAEYEHEYEDRDEDGLQRLAGQ